MSNKSQHHPDKAGLCVTVRDKKKNKTNNFANF